MEKRIDLLTKKKDGTYGITLDGAEQLGDMIDYCKKPNIHPLDRALLALQDFKKTLIISELYEACQDLKVIEDSREFQIEIDFDTILD